MSMTWALNTANDLVITDGKLLVVTGASEVRQRVKTTILHDYQEYFLNTPAGTPWLELILGSKDIATADALLRRIVLMTPGVISIILLNMGISARHVTVSMRLEVQGAIGNDIIDVIGNLGSIISSYQLNNNFIYITEDYGTLLMNELIPANYIVE